MNLTDILKDLEPGHETGCPGLVFRCSFTQYSYEDNRGRVVWGERAVMRQLKKDSCEGCSQCWHLRDELREASCEGEVQIKPYAEHGAKYTLAVVKISTDWETGQVDGWDLAFVKLEEPDEASSQATK